MLFDQPDGLNINRDCGSTHLGQPQGLCARARAGRRRGLRRRRRPLPDGGRTAATEIDGDMIMAICALDMKSRGKLNKNTVVGTIMTNLGFIKLLRGATASASSPPRWATASCWRRCCWRNTASAASSPAIVIFRDFATTGDGQLTAIQLLMPSCAARARKLSELASGDDPLSAGDDQRRASRRTAS